MDTKVLKVADEGATEDKLMTTEGTENPGEKAGYSF